MKNSVKHKPLPSFTRLKVLTLAVSKPMGLLSSAGRLNAKIKPASQGCAFTTRIHSPPCRCGLRFRSSRQRPRGLSAREPGSRQPSIAGARSASRLGFSQVALCEKASIHTKGPFAKVFTHLEKESDSQTHLEGTSRDRSRRRGRKKLFKFQAISISPEIKRK
jgi:hypothetical protein